MSYPITGRTTPLTGELKKMEPAIRSHGDLPHFDDRVCGPTGLANAVQQLFDGRFRFQWWTKTIRIVRAKRDAAGTWQCVDEARIGLSDDADEFEVRWAVGDGPNGMGSHSVISHSSDFSDSHAAVACEIMQWLADPELQLFWMKEDAS